MKTRIRRLGVSLGLIVSMLVSGTAFGAGTAAAATVDLVCEASGVANISPGLNLDAHPFDTTGAGIFSNCLENPANPGPHALSATWTSAGPGFGSCLQLTAVGTVDVTWMLDGGGTDTSVLNYFITASVAPPSGIFQIVIASGRFAGDSIIATLLTPPQFFPPLGCLSPGGVTQASFSALGLAFNLG